MADAPKSILDRELEICVGRLKVCTSEVIKEQEPILGMMNHKFDLNLLRGEMVAFREMLQEKLNFSNEDYLRRVIFHLNGYISATEQQLKISILEDGQVLRNPEIKKNPLRP